MHQRSRTVLGCISSAKRCQSSRHFSNADHAPEMVGIVTDSFSRDNWLEYFPCLKAHNRFIRIIEYFLQGLSLKYQVHMYYVIYNPADLKMQNNFGKIQLIFSACAGLTYFKKISNVARCQFIFASNDRLLQTNLNSFVRVMRKTGRPDTFVKKSPKIQPNPLFVNIT
jgi:hypothetical protein